MEAANLKKAVKGLTNMASVRALKKNKMVTLHTKGMDALTKVEDIASTIRAVFDAEDVEVTALRPLKNGSQAATVKLEDEKAKQLLSRSKIRIGL